MQQDIDAITLEEILARCLQVSKQTLSDNSVALNVRGSPTSRTDHVYGVFGMRQDLPEYWQDYVRNELNRRGVQSEDIVFRKTPAGEECLSPIEAQHLQRIFYSLRESESIDLSEPYHTIEFKVGTRSSYWIFLLRDKFPDGRQN